MTVTPVYVVDTSYLCELFAVPHYSTAEAISEEGMSLVDTTLIDEAGRLRQTTYRGQAWRVHIWTKDQRLKAREPDGEPNAFTGY